VATLEKKDPGGVENVNRVTAANHVSGGGEGKVGDGETPVS